MSLSEREESVRLQISKAREYLEEVELTTDDYREQYAAAVLAHAATMSIITNIQYYRGWYKGGIEARNIYRSGTK